ncbi:MAG: metallophosphoesterase family protein [Bacteroidota bacterium]
MGNRYAISDIHGCFKTFKRLLERIHFSIEDELYLLGDYIDRGPDSKGVIDLIRRLRKKNYTIHCLMGNHEYMLIEELKHNVWPPGVPETLESFKVSHNNQIAQEYVRWFKDLSYYFELDNYILVHAGLSFYSQNPLLDEYDMLWVRGWYGKLDWDWLEDRIILHGHTPIHKGKIESMRDQIDEDRILNIDNGCVFKEQGLNHLCCFNLGTRELIFESNRD